MHLNHIALTPFITDILAKQTTTGFKGVNYIMLTYVLANKDNSPHHNCWVYKIFSAFAEKNNLSLVLKNVEFDKCWRLADADKVDVVATGITPFSDRNLGQASYGNIYSIVKRGIRIKRENVVRNASTNLLDRLNEHVENAGLPNHRPQ